MKETAICENHLYVKAYTKGKKQETKTVSVYILADRHAALLAKRHPEKKRINRIGITVSKKLGKAFERNRAKRVIRHGYREVVKGNNVRVGYLIVIAARSAALSAKSTDVAEDIKKALDGAGMLL